MTAPTTISEAITQNALGPAAASRGEQSVTTKNLTELIEADRYQRAQQAATLGAPFGIRFAAFKPPAAG